MRREEGRGRATTSFLPTGIPRELHPSQLAGTKTQWMAGTKTQWRKRRGESRRASNAGLLSATSKTNSCPKTQPRGHPMKGGRVRGSHNPPASEQPSQIRAKVLLAPQIHAPGNVPTYFPWAKHILPFNLHHLLLCPFLPPEQGTCSPGWARHSPAAWGGTGGCVPPPRR